MTTKEFAHATMLVSSLRTRLGHANALTAAVKRERDDLAKQLAAHVESLKLSNTQCADYHKRIELLAQELHETAAERHRLQLDCDAMQMKIAACDGVINDRDKLHSELVEVRAALATVSAERDSLKRTLQEWEEAETEPHVRVDPDIRMGLISETGPAVFVRIGAPPNDDIADHVVPPVLPMCMTCHGCGSVLYPSPAGDYFGCGDVRCTRSNTKHWHPGCTIGPYAGPCKSTTPVRHE